MKLKNIVKWLIAVAILTNCVGMLFPSLSSTFTPYYGSIVKHMVLSHNWLVLMQSGHDWLDKPHLPFWFTAASFSVFGINSFAYILPGFLFNILGIFYTYKLAKFWYAEEAVGKLAALFTASALHLMLSSIDVRAEAYLVGEIMPACYYWLLYDEQNKIKYLLLGALFTALAIMTKGIFVLVTIVSGIACLWIYQKRWRNFISLKWLGALSLALTLVFPEIIALYCQFDAHPEKVVFGQTHISGIKWFFWDSQFGRFLNIGPIMSTNPPPLHYLFFVHTFLWAYLPWWPIFIVAVFSLCSKFKLNKAERGASVFLLASFFVTFALFSATKFQVDHYTNIIFPFASIICARWFYTQLKKNKVHFVCYIEIGLAVLLTILVIALSHYVLSGLALCFILAASLGCLLVFAGLAWQQWWLKTLVYPTLAMALVFVFAMFSNGLGYAKYDAGYQIARYLNQAAPGAVFGYQIDLLSLDLHANNPYQLVDNLAKIKMQHKPFYLVTKPEYESQLTQNFVQVHKVKTIAGGSIETYLANVTDKQRLGLKLSKYIIVKVN